MDTNKEKILEQKSQLSPTKQALLQKRLRGEVKPDSQSNVIPRRSSLGPAPLSFVQQQLWFIDKLQPGNSAYNESLAVHLTGSLDVVSLQQSLNEMVRRHEILRTTFTQVEGEPVQVIASNINIALPLVDLRSLPPQDREIKAQQLANEQAKQPFDLAKGPLWQWCLLRLSEQEHILLITNHHIIIDAWSVKIFFEELSHLYKAFATNTPSSLPELPIQYADFAIWQRQWLQGAVLEKLLSYWKKQLKNAPSLLQLPTDFPRPKTQTFRGATKSFCLPNDLLEQLKVLSQKEGVTLFMTLLAAFQTLLHRYTGQDDIVVGSPIANRNRPEVKELIGFFANTLVLRTNLGGDLSFRQLLVKVRECTLSAYTHQDLPFERLVEELQPERNLSYNPLIQVMFILENTPTVELNLPNVTVSHLVPENPIAKLDLSLNIYETLNIYENSSGLTGVFRYNTDLFEPATISRMAEHFCNLLWGIVNNPDQLIANLPLLSKAEQHQMLVEWNNTQVDYPTDLCFHQLFEAQVKRVPYTAAILFQEQQLSYWELNQRANQLAHYLQAHSVGPEVLVGICVERTPEMIVAMLAVLKAGGAYLPLDPTYPKERLAFMLSDSQVPLLLTTEKLMSVLPEHQAQVICLDTDWEKISQHTDHNPQSGVQTHNLAYLIYTSGSTGTPKGVLVPHAGLTNLTQDKIRTCRVQEDSRILQFFSFSFDASIPEIIMALGSGAALCLGTPESLLPGPALLQLLRNHSITHMTIIPSGLAALPKEELPALQMVLVGGEACSPELIEYWSQGRLFINAYGPTETTVNASMVECGNNGQKLPTVRPAANKQLYILDQNLQLVPIGVAGELYIGGVGLARGYLNRPDKTAEVFIHNPFNKEPESRLYKTGDLACYLPDGNIKLLGRLDHQVKIRGFRIELGEIEALLSQHPQVRDCVAIAREDHPGDKRLVAYVVPETGHTPTTTDLRRFIEDKLPEYMIPAVFVILEALPLNPSGKVDRQALPAPGTERPELDEAFAAPHTPVEKALASIWTELLGLEQIGIHDNFFDLGGDSILSTQFIARANRVGFEFTTKQLFEHQTIAELADVVGTALVVEAEQGIVTGSVPLTPIQHWFFEQNWSEPHHFNQSILLEGPPNLKPELLKQVIQQLLLHHDALRLRFIPSASGFEQVNASPDETVSFSVIDLSAFSPSEQKSALEATAVELNRSLNLQEGPLVQVALFLMGANEPSRLLLVIHHLAVDGVSWRILLEDLQTAYTQLNQGEVVIIPSKTTSFKQWAERLSEWAQSTDLQQEIDYWLTPLVQQQPLPVDYLDGDNTVASEGMISVSLSPAETQALLQEVPKAYQTQINDVLLTALVRTFEQWTGNKSLLVDLEGHGREEIFDDVNLSRTVGWFTTVFPVLLNLGEASEPGDALKIVKEQLRSIPNRGIGYGVLRYLSPHKPLELQAKPDAQISFNYLGQLDQVFSSSLFALAKESSGQVNSPTGKRFHLLEVNSMVMNAQLQVNWSYSKAIHNSRTIETLAQGFIKALQSLIVHCQSLKKGDTSANFAESNLSQPHSKSSSCLVALQPHGSKPPIFFAHGLGGTVIFYYQLARYLGSDQPFYGLQSPGVDGETEPLTRIEDMASEYIKALRSLQPNGPYFLGGWSMGAFIAWEMATQLQDQGQEVALVAILSQAKALSNRYSDDGDDAKMFVQLFKDLADSVGKDSSISYTDLVELQPNEQQKYVFEQMKIAEILPFDLEFWQFCNYMQVIRSNIKATSGYLPQVYQNHTRVLLFRTSDMLADNITDPTFGWGELISEQVEIHDIPSDHLTLLNEPHVQVLAENLRHCLNQIPSYKKES